jgi:hypothetical protein
MAESFRPEFNYAQAPSPGRTQVLLDANVKLYLGQMVDTVAGYARVPASGDAATGRMRGICETTTDNTGGAQGALAVSVRPGVYCFANSLTNPCSQATVGALVYAADGNTISTSSADGPKAGTLIEFLTSSPQGTPCKVVLICDMP